MFGRIGIFRSLKFGFDGVVLARFEGLVAWSLDQSRTVVSFWFLCYFTTPFACDGVFSCGFVSQKLFVLLLFPLYLIPEIQYKNIEKFHIL